MDFNRYSQMPMYEQIVRIIEKKIATGTYKKGQLMPSESEMQKTYEVSRITVRKAYKQLTDSGVLKTVKGKGTFVNDVDLQDWTWMSSFFGEVKKSGRVPSSAIIDFKADVKKPELAKEMDLPEDTLFFYFKRIRMIDNKPVWLTETYIKESICEGLTPEYFSVKGITQSIFRVLELNFNCTFSNMVEKTSVAKISERDALLLDIDFDKPMVTRSALFQDERGKTTIFEQTFFEQSIVKLHQ